MQTKNQKTTTFSKRTASFFMTIMLVLSIVPFGIFSASAASLNIPSGAKYYNGHMYYLYKSEATWTKAKKLCESRGGHLVTITSKGENDFVASMVKGDDAVWIGIYQKDKNSSFKWVTNEKVSYKNWLVYINETPYKAPQYVISDKENYGALYNDGTWENRLNESLKAAIDYNDSGWVYDNSIQGYICEWEVGMPTGITQVSSSASSITLSWKDNDLVSKYVIYYYDASAKKYIKYKTVTKTSITISGLSSATTHKIGICSVLNNNGKTLITPKTYFNAVTLPGTTKNLKIEDKISLVWSAVRGADGYVVYSYDSDTKKWEVFDVVKKNSCKIGKKFGNATQQFRVRAFKRSTDGKKFYGGYSNTVKR
ncbi:MAG: lectin-like protein [Acutalibacteraceae bacterium]